jgi:iron complex outermembrane receptor protein
VIDMTPNIENYTIASFTRSDDTGGVQKVIACAEATAFGAGFACPQLGQNAGEGFYTVQQDLTHPETLTYNYQLINTTTWHASDAFTLKNIASYSEAFQRVNNALFGTDWPIGGGLPPIVFSTIQSAPGDWTSAEFTFTNELQAQGTVLNDRLTYQGGVYVEGSDPISAGGNQSPVFASCFNVAALECSDPVGIGYTAALGFPVQVASENYTVGETWYRDYGVFEQSTYTITDQLKATGGARFTFDQTTNTSQRITYQFPVTPPYTQGPNQFLHGYHRHSGKLLWDNRGNLARADLDVRSRVQASRGSLGVRQICARLQGRRRFWQLAGKLPHLPTGETR